MLPLSSEAADAIAGWAALAAPRLCREDARQEAWIGILKAQRDFDPTRGASLFTYARIRAWGAVLDYLRRVDPLGRQTRREVVQGHRPAPVRVHETPELAVASCEETVIRRRTAEQLASQLTSHWEWNAVQLTLAGEEAHAPTLGRARRKLLALAA